MKSIQPNLAAISHRSAVQAMQRQKGVSLVELMVAMTIGLFLLGAVGIVYISTSRATQSSTVEAEMNEDASLALEILQQQIRLAGYSSTDGTGKRNFAGIAVRGCAGDFKDTTDAFGSLACETTGEHALAVRFEATSLNSQVTSASLPANCAYEGIDALTADAEDAKLGTTLADNRYYIDSNTLYCVGRTGTGFGTATALIPNIEKMTIKYGVTAALVSGKPMPNQITAYVGAGDTVLGNTALNWNRVVAVQVCLLARSSTPVPVGDNTNTDLSTYVDCTGTKQTGITDRYLRRAYTTTIQLRNMRPDLPSAYAANTDPYKYD